MDLLIIGIHFAPELTGIGKYTGEMAAWLSERGHRVTVVAPPPFYPGWAKDPSFEGKGWHRELWNGCTVIRCPIYVPRRVTGSRRLLHLSSFALSTLPFALRSGVIEKPDIVAAVAPTLLAAPIALAAARLASAKTWLHIQDLEIEMAFELGIIRGRRLADAVLGAERRLLRRFDLVSSISPKMLSAVERKGIEADRLALVPNWVDLEGIAPLPPSVRMRRELGIPEGRPIALYSGSMGLKQGLEVVVDAARKLAHLPRGPMFVLAGSGPALTPLRETAAGLSNVMFLPLQPAERFNEFLSLADIHLLPQRHDAADLVMPSKLGAMLASGRPVVATVAPGTQIAETLGTAGVIVPPGDAERLASELQRLLEDPERRMAMGRTARAIAPQFDRRTILGALESRLSRICNGANEAS
jgi:colanic acid biosynthesis glycosyl transferase WcaI